MEKPSGVIGGFHNGDLTDLYSNPLELPFTPIELRALEVPAAKKRGLNSPVSHRSQELSKRLGTSKVSELVARAEAGESVRSIGGGVGVANAAPKRMLREEGLPISKRKANADEAAMLKVEYELGATVRELEKRFGLSHGTVFRALNI